MNDFRLVAGKKAMIIVAHPDDETIWMGGTILNNPELKWTIFSLCRSSDKDREPKFRRVCKLYGAEAIISDLDDEGKLDLDELAIEAEKIIEENIRNRDFAYLFTHGKNGEYGHEVHKAAHIAIDNLILKNLIRPEAVFYFSYKKNAAKNPLVLPLSKSDIRIPLAEPVFEEKRKIVAEMYGYPYDGIDVNYCTNLEAFQKRVF